MPDTYTSQFSGEEIDAALRAAQIISGADTPAELREKLEIRGDTIPVSATDPTPVSEALTASGGGVNPNLLDNWYFANPINQRGQTEYAAVGYTVDRWLIGAGSNGTLSLTESGIKLTRTDGVMYLAHRIPKTQIPEGNTLTYSALTTLGLYSISFVVKNDIYHEQDVGGGISLGWNYSPAEMMELTLVNNTVNSDVTILAAKLELGSTQTLAHKEGDKWVLNEIPDFGEQLRRCQMYYLGDTQRDGYGKSTSNNEIYVVVPLPATMRAKPVIASSSKWGNLISGDGEITGISSIEVAALMDNLVILRVVTNSTISTNKAFIMTDTRFALSADL